MLEHSVTFERDRCGVSSERVRRKVIHGQPVLAVMSYRVPRHSQPPQRNGAWAGRHFMAPPPAHPASPGTAARRPRKPFGLHTGLQSSIVATGGNVKFRSGCRNSTCADPGLCAVRRQPKRLSARHVFGQGGVASSCGAPVGSPAHSVFRAGRKHRTILTSGPLQSWRMIDVPPTSSRTPP